MFFFFKSELFTCSLVFASRACNTRYLLALFLTLSCFLSFFSRPCCFFFVIIAQTEMKATGHLERIATRIEKFRIDPDEEKARAARHREILTEYEPVRVLRTVYRTKHAAAPYCTCDTKIHHLIITNFGADFSTVRRVYIQILGP